MKDFKWQSWRRLASGREALALLLAVFDQWRLDERRLLARLRYGNSLEAAAARPWRKSVMRAFRAVAESQTPGRVAVGKRFMALGGESRRENRVISGPKSGPPLKTAWWLVRCAKTVFGVHFHFIALLFQ